MTSMRPSRVRRPTLSGTGEPSGACDVRRVLVTEVTAGRITSDEPNGNQNTKYLPIILNTTLCVETNFVPQHVFLYFDT